MDSTSVLKYIQETGFRTLEAIKENFSNENHEVLDALLTFLITKNMVRKVPYQSPSGTTFLIYVVPKD
jgi:hypothetical protein